MAAIARLLVEHQIAAPGELAGCSEDEIRALEAHYGRALPAAYREFLRVMGRHTGGLFAETAIHCGPRLFALRDEAAALLAAHGALPLPEDAIVFALHGDDAFDYIRAGEGDDPPVYQFAPGMGASAPQPIDESFTRYLKGTIAFHLSIVNEWAAEEAVAAREAAAGDTPFVYWLLLAGLVALFFAIATYGDEVSRALFP